MRLLPSAIIIDDDKELAATLAYSCEVAGFEGHVLDAAEGLEHLANNLETNCIVLDLNMPQMDGIEFIYRLNTQKMKTPPVLILISGTDDELLKSVEKLAKNQGFNVIASLQKPFRIKDFINHLRGLPHGSTEIETTELERALVAQEFDQVYQPLLDINSGQWLAIEALSRWHSSLRGPLSPDRFIPILENSDLIHAFTIWSFEKATQTWRTLASHGLEIPICINVSANCLTDPTFATSCLDIIAKANVPYHKINIEVTETASLKNEKIAHKCLSQFRLYGCRLAIDDFGTGHSSLQKLIGLPFTDIKIDKCFIFELLSDPAAEAIVKAVVSLSESLGRCVVAEGIESTEVALRLQELGVHVAQGFYFAKPMEMDELLLKMPKTGDITFQSMVS